MNKKPSGAGWCRRFAFPSPVQPRQQQEHFYILHADRLFGQLDKRPGNLAVHPADIPSPGQAEVALLAPASSVAVAQQPGILGIADQQHGMIHLSAIAAALALIDHPGAVISKQLRPAIDHHIERAHLHENALHLRVVQLLRQRLVAVAEATAHAVLVNRSMAAYGHGAVAAHIGDRLLLRQAVVLDVGEGGAGVAALPTGVLHGAVQQLLLAEAERGVAAQRPEFFTEVTMPRRRQSCVLGGLPELRSATHC
ncbi:hypothetical protein TYRP_016112 [Tyrophagus putrescentiae]|nr:hypothetical protein TYRP_016112 [Tyrophagus putrescentiae]